MQSQILQNFSKVNLIDELISQLKQSISLNAEREELPFSKLVITRIDSDKIHFKFSFSGRDFSCSVTWQKFLANQVFVNQIKFN